MSYIPLQTSPTSDIGERSRTTSPSLSLDEVEPFLVTPAIARRIYLSHSLPTWNSRVFEFGAVLYLATIFPGTLLPMSIYAFIRGVSAIVFASPIGQYIDVGERLQVVRVSISEYQFILH